MVRSYHHWITSSQLVIALPSAAQIKSLTQQLPLLHCEYTHVYMQGRKQLLKMKVERLFALDT